MMKAGERDAMMLVLVVEEEAKDCEWPLKTGKSMEMDLFLESRKGCSLPIP